MILQELHTQINGAVATNDAILAHLQVPGNPPAIAGRYQHVRVMITNATAAGLPNPTLVSWEDFQNGSELRLHVPPLPGFATVNAYWLPWDQDTGYHVDIPAPAPPVPPALPVPPAAPLIITPPLTGCYVGVQNMGTNIRIYHYNAAPALTAADLQRYGCDNWLIPNTLPALPFAGIPNAVFYPNNTTIWGEFIGGAWHFFYKTRQNNNINLFL
jgi:hypothetical protein